MKRLKTTLLASALSLSVVMPAFANEAQPMAAPLPQFTAADTQSLFEQDAQPMQLAALSQKEMKELYYCCCLYLAVPQLVLGATMASTITTLVVLEPLPERHGRQEWAGLQRLRR